MMNKTEKNNFTKNNEVEIIENTYIGCRIKYCLYEGGGISIYDLYVHKLLRRKGIARLLLESAIKDIKLKYPNVNKIYLTAKPFGNIGLKKQQLIKFYSKFKELVIVT